MANFGSPVASPNPVGQGLQTLSGILNIKQGQQALQLGQQEIAGNAAELQQKQQLMQERLGIQQMMQTGKDDRGQSILGDDGQPDPAKFLTAVGRVAPLSGQQYAQNIIKSHTDAVGLQSASQALDAQGRGLLMGPIQAAALDPKTTAADVTAGIDNLVQAHPEMGNAAGYLKGLVGHLDAVQDPKQRMQVIQQIAARMQPGQQVQTQPTAGTVNNGAIQSQGTFAPPVAGGGFTPATQTQNRLSPQIITNPTTGGPAVVGGVAGANASPISGAGMQPTAGQPQIQADIEAARKIGDSVPVNRDINTRILRLADQTSTGPGSNTIHQIGAALGLPSGANYQEVGAFLDRQAAMAQQAMGLPNTNAGLEAAKAFTGNTEYDNKVVKDKTRFVDALNTAAGAYRSGLDKVVGTGPTPNYSAYQQFRGQWTKNFDPNVFAYENAIQRGDKQAQQEIEKDEGRKGMAELLQKRRALMSLVNGQ